MFKVSTRPPDLFLRASPGVSSPLMDPLCHVYTARSCFMEFSPVTHLWVEFHFPAEPLTKTSWHPWKREFLPCHHPSHNPHLSAPLPKGHPNSQWHLMPLCHCLCRQVKPRPPFPHCLPTLGDVLQVSRLPQDSPLWPPTHPPTAGVVSHPVIPYTSFMAILMPNHDFRRTSQTCNSPYTWGLYLTSKL